MTINPLRYFNQFTQVVENKLNHDYVSPLSDIVSWRLGISRHRLAQGVTFVGILCVLTTFFSGFVSNTIGIVYPAYKSIQSLIGINSNFKRQRQINPLEDQQWLCYWVVYSLLMYVELAVGFLVSWIPFYHVMKILFLMWCMLPWYNGANVLFTYFIVPQIQKYQPLIENELKTILESNDSLSVNASNTATTTKPLSAESTGTLTTTTSTSSVEEHKGDISIVDKSLSQNPSASQKMASLISTISSVPSLTRQVIRSSVQPLSSTTIPASSASVVPVSSTTT